ncbi:MAG: ribulose-phosphate 3-epimerase [Ardenticatenia bacterium]|nr:ribulose-phosphate 3-epimerase [Ardenticatenia bacterium]
MAARSVHIIPSILSADFANLEAAVRAAEEAGADAVQVDVMDGHFVPNITVGLPVVAALRRVTRLPLDVHLMIEAPDRYVDAFVEAGANVLTVHVEACCHLHRTVQHIRELGALAGVALNPATPAIMLQDILHDVDVVVVMTVNPGFGGQAFIESVVPKIERVRHMLDRAGRSDVPIEVDGGISKRTAPRVVAAGASWLVAGSAVYGHPAGVREAVRELREAIGQETGKGDR